MHIEPIAMRPPVNRQGPAAFRRLPASALCGAAGVAVRNARRRLFAAGAAESGGAASAVASGTGRDHRLQRLESVLFLSREPLTTRKLSQYANLADGTEARTLIRRLNDLYDCSGRAFRVERVAGGYQILTRAQFSGWVRRLEHVPHETRLSAPALETLAVIAYRQPVLRADIEAIRGVNCGEILRQLMERDLVRIGGRSDDLGRPYLYTTTRRFLQTFGLDSLESLPRVERMQAGEGNIAVLRGESGNGNRSTSDGETSAAQRKGGSSMPLKTLSALDRDETLLPPPGDEFAEPPIASFDDDDDNYDEFYDADEDEEEEDEVKPDVDEDVEEEEDLEKEDDEFEELEEELEEEDEDFDDEDEDEEWEEVDDEEDSDWDDEDSDWDDELDDDDDDEEEEEDVDVD